MADQVALPSRSILSRRTMRRLETARFQTAVWRRFPAPRDIVRKADAYRRGGVQRRSLCWAGKSAP